jgi:hypothetical protein
MTSTQTLTAINLSSARWIENGFLAGFDAGRYFGIVNADGDMLTFDGVTPAAWKTKSIAAEIASGGLTGAARWIKPA